MSRKEKTQTFYSNCTRRQSYIRDVIIKPKNPPKKPKKNPKKTDLYNRNRYGSTEGEAPRSWV